MTRKRNWIIAGALVLAGLIAVIGLGLASIRKQREATHWIEALGSRTGPLSEIGEIEKEEIRSNAAWLLPAAVQIVRDRAVDADGRLEQFKNWVLRKMGADKPLNVQALVSSYGGTFLLFEVLGEQAASAAPDLEQILLDEGATASGRNEAVRLLGCIGLDAVPGLRIGLCDPAEEVSRHALISLMQLGPAASPATGDIVEYLAAVPNDDDHWFVIAALCDQGTPKPIIREVLKRAPFQKQAPLGSLIVDANRIHELKLLVPAASFEADHLLDQMHSDTGSFRRQIEALAALAPDRLDEVRDVVANRIHNEDLPPGERNDAVTALKYFSPDDSEIQDLLIYALKSQRRGLRWHGMRCLDEWEPLPRSLRAKLIDVRDSSEGGRLYPQLDLLLEQKQFARKSRQSRQ